MDSITPHTQADPAGLVTFPDQASLVTFPEHESRFGGEHRILLLSSVADMAAIAPYVPIDVVAVCLQKAHEWRDPSTKVPYSALERIAGASEAVIAFSEMNTHAGHVEATELGAHLGMLTTVKFSPANPSSVASRVAATSEVLRETFALNLLSNSKRTPGGRPKPPSDKATVSTIPIVDVQNARIVTPARGDTPEIVWLNAAPERRTEVALWNDFDDPHKQAVTLRHDLLIHATSTDGLVRSHIVTDVDDAKLVKPRLWLNRTPGGAAISPNPNYSSADKQIESAIRHHMPEAVDRRIALQRTGWFLDQDGAWGYTSPSGHLRADGLSDKVTSDVAPLHKAFELADTRGLTREDEIAAAGQALTTLSELGTHEARTALIGVTAYALGGLSGHGRGVGCVPTFVGAPASGKSHTLRRYFRSFLAPTATGATLRAHDTGAILRNAYRGMDGAVVVADDFKNVPYDTHVDSEYKKFDNLTRPGYEGSAGGSAKSEPDANGNWAAASSDSSSPAIFIGTEILPTGSIREIQSTVERLFVVEITKENAFKTGDAEAWDEATADPRNALHLAAFVTWVAGRLDEAETLAKWREPWLEIESKERKKLRALHSGVGHRGAEVAVAPLVGVILWTSYLVDIGAMTGEERDKFVDRTRAAISGVAEKHALMLSGGGSPADAILDTIHGGIVSGKVYVGGHTDATRAQRIGGEELVGGIRRTVLFPDAVLEFLRRDPRFRTMSRIQLGKDLEPALIVQEGKEKRNTWKVRMGGNPINVFVISSTRWELSDDSFD